MGGSHKAQVFFHPNGYKWLENPGRHALPSAAEFEFGPFVLEGRGERSDGIRQRQFKTKKTKKQVSTT